MEISFLFGAGGEWWGEIHTKDGSFSQVVLTPEGERDIGRYVEEWQTRGVPVRREISTHAAGRQDRVFYIERIQMRDRSFVEALRGWMEGHGYALLSITPLMNDVWPVIRRVPLNPREQFTFLVLLRGASLAEGQAWKEVLREAERAVDAEGRMSVAGLSRLRAQSVGGLNRAFEKKDKEA